MRTLRHYLLLLALLAAAALPSQAAEKFQGQCRTDAGVASNACTVTVYDQGTTDVSDIFSDYGLTTPKANPFTADSSGRFSFYGADARYDVVLSGGTPALTTVTLGDVQLGTAVAGAISSLTLVMPGQFTVSGSPLTTAGTITVSQATQAANTFFAGPASGADAAPTFRTPGLGEFSGDSDDITQGSTNLYFTNALARAAISVGSNLTYDSGTGVIALPAVEDPGAGAVPKGEASGGFAGLLRPTWFGTGTPGSTNYLRGDRTWAVPAFSEISGAVTDAQVPNTITLTSIAQADDVDLTGLTNGQCLVYDGLTDNRFEPGTCGSGSGGGPEVNNLESDGAEGIADTEIFVGTGAGTGNYVVMSGDATITNLGVVAVVDDSHAHTGTTISALDAGDVTTGAFADARVSQSSVTQHQAALALAASQVTSGTFADARISESSVIQHVANTQGLITFPYVYDQTYQYGYVYIPSAVTIVGNPLCISSTGTFTANIYQSDSPFTNANPVTLVSSMACSTTEATAVPDETDIAAGKYIRVVYSSPSGDPLGSVAMVVE